MNLILTRPGLCRAMPRVAAAVTTHAIPLHRVNFVNLGAR